MVEPEAKKAALAYVRDAFGFSDRRASKLVGLYRSTLHYKGKPRDDKKLVGRILELAHRHKRWRAPMIHVVARRDGLVVNHKRTDRIYYKVLGLSVRKRNRKKLRAATRVPLASPTRVNQCWTMDFVHDTLSSGRKLKCLNVLDEYTRECLVIEADSSIGGGRVARVLDMLKDFRGLPEAIRLDNGPEFTSKVMDKWAYENKVKLSFIAPGKPSQNAFVESFNGKFRDDCLNANCFDTMCEAREEIEAWRTEYNGFRPHSSLGDLTPLAFAAKGIGEVESNNLTVVR